MVGMPRDAASGTRGNLPAELTTFVGRHNELAETRRLIRSARLVTLTGIGGVGKTRLALRAADKSRASFPDGVWLAELGELSDPSLLATVVAGTFGARAPAGQPPEDALVDLLADTDCLLVLDNCEQVVEAVAALCDRLLRRCRLVHILCTSREALRAGGEALLGVPPLTVPRERDTGLADSDAMTLFVERAAAAVPGFSPDGDTATVIADICRRLDGLPLAIELAAARLRTLSPRQILDRLADRFALLTHGGRGAPARQQTLRLCVDWSYELCSRPEQVLWSRLAFFAGSVDLDAAAAVCGPENLLDLVTSLVEKSILVREESGGAPVRFRMLETLREYGQQRAREQGRAEDAIDRVTRWCADFTEAAYAEFIGPRQLEWIARVDRELPNVRDVLTTPGTGLRIAAALFPFWNSRGSFSEGRHWLDQLLAQDTGEDLVTLASVVYADCVLAAFQGDLAAVAALDTRAGQIGAAGTEPLAPLVSGTVALTEGIAALFRGDHDRARSRLTDAVTTIATEDGTDVLHLAALTMLAFAHELGSDRPRALQCFDDALAITVERGESVFRSYLLWGSGVSLWRGGRGPEAAQRLREGLRLADDVGHPLATASCLEALAWIAADADAHRRAAALLGAADVLSHRTESVPTFFPALLVHHRECEHRIRAALGKRDFAVAYRTGTELAIAGEVHSLLATTAPPPPTTDAAPLTRREWEVAALVGRGLTNRAIAHELVISERTVHGHIEHILAKLNMSSRVQVAAWLVQRTGA
jgi:non-specific serine/threonine protein kinase